MQQVQGLGGWVALLSAEKIPVLKHTVRQLERLHADEEHLNARGIAHLVTGDPMMTLRLLRHLQAHRRRGQTQELIQVEQGVIMMGLEPFFREIPVQPLVEDVLRDHPAAQLQLLRTVRRAQRAARYAFDWALLLHDLHAEEVRIAALLACLSEMLLWCFDPASMLHMRAMQDADKTLRSAAVQEQVLGFKVMDLQRELEAAWNLPRLLQQLTDPDLALNARVQNVMLAMNLARHSANGWDDAALPDDYREIGQLLRMEPDKVMAIVGASPSLAAV